MTRPPTRTGSVRLTEPEPANTRAASGGRTVAHRPTDTPAQACQSSGPGPRRAAHGVGGGRHRANGAHTRVVVSARALQRSRALAPRVRHAGTQVLVPTHGVRTPHTSLNTCAVAEVRVPQPDAVCRPRPDGLGTSCASPGRCVPSSPVSAGRPSAGFAPSAPDAHLPARPRQRRTPVCRLRPSAPDTVCEPRGAVCGPHPAVVVRLATLDSDGSIASSPAGGRHSTTRP